MADNERTVDSEIPTVKPIGERQRPGGNSEIMFTVEGARDLNTASAVADDYASLIGGRDTRLSSKEELAGVQTEIGAARTGKAAYFSSSRWRAPWQPTGPRPPWGHNNDATEGKPN